ESGSEPADGDDGDAPATKKARRRGPASKGAPRPDPTELALANATAKENIRPRVPQAPDPEMVSDDEKVFRPDRPVPLGKLMDDPSGQSGNLINLERLYILGRTVQRRPDGILQVALLECEPGARPQGKPASYEVPIDRRLADVIKGAGKIPREASTLPDQTVWDSEPALVTIKVHDGREAVPFRIVRLEFLKNYNATVNGTDFDFDVEVLRATESGSESGQGNRFEWRRMGRLGRVYSLVMRQAKAAKAAKNNMISQQMSALANQALRSGIQQGLSNAAAVGSMRRSVMGR
ncbi:MAG: hypothetical protein K2X91_02360, partial [Thermoleophilia bacterium]|nr:hypothetical protein [Thermoleophilia bacterium]